MDRRHFVNSTDADALLNHVLESVDNILQFAGINIGLRTQMLNELRNKEMAWMECRISESNSELCPYCDGAEPLVVGKINDVGIAIRQETGGVIPSLVAYGYDIHGSGSNGLAVRINYCPICGKYLGRTQAKGG